jgi:hypothetical protein
MERHSMNPLLDWRLQRALLVLAGSMGLAAPALAADAADEHAALAEKSSAEEGGELVNLVAVKLAYLHIDIPGEDAEAAEGSEGEAGAEGEVLQRAGVAISYERVLIPGWLEAEITALFAPGEGGLTLPVDLVLKKPFELTHEWEAFVGLGLATEWFEAGEQETAYGLGTQLGGHYWLDEHFAIELEGEYNLLLHPETAHEVVVAAGGAFRF